MKRSYILASAVAAFALPLFAFAQAVVGNPSHDSIRGIVILMNQVINNLLPFMMVLIFVYFFYGLAKYVLSSGDAEKASEGKTIMIHGVIALFVAVSIYGIIAWLQVFFGATGTAKSQTIVLPDVKIPTVTK